MLESLTSGNITLFWRILVAILVIYLIYVVVMYFLQRSIMFPGQHLTPPARNPSSIPGLESWWISTTDGLVEAWFIPTVEANERNPRPAVIYIHGNGELIDYWPKHLSGFLNRGISVLLMEYPGYGRSDGKPSAWGIEETVTGAYDQLAGHPSVDPMRIIAYGRSLGGGAACLLADSRHVSALILESTFISTATFANKMLLPGFLIRDKFDNRAILQEYTGPVLIFHGTKDDVIPFSHGEALAESAPQAMFISYYCRHNDCPPNVTQYWVDMAAFLQHAELID